MSTTDELRMQRKMLNEAGPLARTAASNITDMPEVLANYWLVLDALLDRVTDVTWGDMSEVRELLADARDRLEEVTAYTQEELNQFARERMEA